MTFNTTQAIGISAVVALTLGLAFLLPFGPHPPSSPLPSGVAATAVNGLELRLSVNSTTISHGGHLSISVSEYNTLGKMNNISKEENWVVQGRLGACGDAVYPFGISVYQGRYDLGNVSQGTQLQVFPFMACPLFIRLITGYAFQPTSENATILPGNLNFTTAMVAETTVGQNYTNSYPLQSQPLPAGLYTVAASDEWGNIVFLYVNFR